MKTSYKLLFPILLMLFSNIVRAQNTLISLGGNYVKPGSNSGIDFYAGSGFGGSARIETSLGKHTYGMATVEYFQFSEKENYEFGNKVNTSNFSAMPLQIGLRHFIGTQEERLANGFFISFELGVMPTKTHFTYTNGSPDFEYKESGLSVAPGIGYQISRVEASIRPQFNLAASGFNVYYLNFRLAYVVFRKFKEPSSEI
jgi:hypothetical protein